jgi:hypothetical protein
MKIRQRLAQELNNIIYSVQSHIRNLPNSVQHAVPLVTQFSVPDKAESTLKKHLHPTDDTDWIQSGATSQEQYVKWVFTMCGMACTAMVLKYFKHTSVLPVVLAEDAILSHVYQTHADGTLSGMRYFEFTKWVQKFDIQAYTITRLDIRGIQSALAHNKLVIVSVNPNIRGLETVSTTQRGGHLVLITGYDLVKATLTINNPSGFSSTNTQHQHTISVSSFSKYYARRGIILSNQQP